MFCSKSISLKEWDFIALARNWINLKSVLPNVRKRRFCSRIKESSPEKQNLFPLGRLYTLAALLCAVMLVYGILWDVLLIAILFCSSYAIADGVMRHGVLSGFIKTAVGLGILGIFIYYILLFGVGSTSVYALILLLPCCMNWKPLLGMIRNLAEKSKHCTKKETVVFFLFLLYLIYASAPIARYDTLTKHLPVCVYAADSGAWYTNVIESLVYGETMVLQYTYSTLFVTFNAYKALTIFNVILFFMIYHEMMKFAGSLTNRNWNSCLLISILFSTPFFFEFSTIFYLEMLPVFFLIATILSFNGSEWKKKSWNNLPVTAFLAGCSVFVKLTISYSLLVIGILCIMLCIRYWMDNRFGASALVKKFAAAGICFIIPFAGSLINIWYRTGNPLFPYYNEFFQSPYFSLSNTADPFQNVLGVNFHSLWNIVFHTSQNIEMRDLGMGYYLLFLWSVPVAGLIFKQKKLLLWLVMMLIAFQTANFFTYNIRYSMAIFMILALLIAISLSLLIEGIRWKKARVLTYCVLSMLIALPNMSYIYNYYSLPQKMKPDAAVTEVGNQSVLSEVPKGKKVFSMNDPFKGEYRGVYNAYIWHNRYNMNRIRSGDISLKDYISSFDYVLYRKNVNTEPEIIDYLEGEALTQLEWCAESESHILYRVVSGSPEEPLKRNDFEAQTQQYYSRELLRK